MSASRRSRRRATSVRSANGSRPCGRPRGRGRRARSRRSEFRRVRRGADLAELLVEAPALVGDRALGRAWAQVARRAARVAIAARAARSVVRARERRSARTALRSTRISASARVGRGRAADGGDVVDQRVIDLVADRADDRQPQVRDRAAEVLVAEGPEVGEAAAAAADDRDLDRGDLREAAKRDADRAAPRGGPGPGASAQTIVPRQPRRSSPASRSAHGGRVASGDDADRLRDRGAGEGLLRLQQPLGVEPAAGLVELGEQVALAGEADVVAAEAEAGRGGAAAGVVVGPAGDDRPRRRP